jgi:hypothetical protein
MAGDGPLLACVLAYRSYAAEADGDLPTAHAMLSEAETLVRSEGSAATRAWVAARQAEVLSAFDATNAAALRALDRAITAYDYAHPHRERSWTTFFTPSRLGSMVVATYARVQHPQLDATTESVVASLPSTDAKIKAVMLADVALAALQNGRYSRGAELANQALDHTLLHEASLGRQRLHTVHQIIRDKRHVAELAALDDRLTAHISA